MGWVSLLLHIVHHLPGVGLNSKVAFAKGWRSGPRTVIFVAMEMNIKSLVHHFHLSRMWGQNGQVGALTSLVADALVNEQKWRNSCSGMP